MLHEVLLYLSGLAVAGLETKSSVGIIIDMELTIFIGC